jgi:hypothetical protein
MSDNKTAWMALWRRALAGAGQASAFEISEVVPQVAAKLKVTAAEARKVVEGC